MADTPTRRTYLKRAGAVVGAALAAGCAGDASDPATGGNSAADGAATGGAETGDTATGADGESAPSHTASMKPTGEVTFEGVPETVFTVFPQYADMAVALGHGDAVNAVYVPEMSGTTMNTTTTTSTASRSRGRTSTTR